MATESLEAAIRRVGSPEELMRNTSARTSSIGFTPAEFTNWRTEARSWQTSCALLDQSHHMTDLFVSGPGTRDLLARVAVNSFATFGRDRAKQFIAVNDDGYLIGDAILFGLEDDAVDLVGPRPVIDWLEFQAVTGDHDLEVERDVPSFDRRGRPPRLYRYELQGPATTAVMEKLLGGPLPDVRFFHMTSFEIGGHRIRALRHGMAGEVGFELFGPWDEGDAVRELILAAGAELGIEQVGARAYSIANLESGWVPMPVPAIFSGAESDRAYREWLPATAVGSLGGSLSGAITDYYLTPYDLGYDRSVRFDHDFIGSDALSAMADEPHRRKVSLIWEAEDVTRVIASAFSPGPTYKYLQLPKSRYATHHCDEVLADGRRVGISMDCGVAFNEDAFISLAVVDESVSRPGTQVGVVWGEDPVSAKALVEPHEQTMIRATVAPCPLARFARESYRTAGLAGRS